jgi:hypothetical protein
LERGTAEISRLSGRKKNQKMELEKKVRNEEYKEKEEIK